jgi:hypothetical protein
MADIWTPPGDWTTAIPNASWYRVEGGTAVLCAVATPKTMPALDGGEWTEPELWTVRVPAGDDDLTRAPGPTVVWCPGWIYTMHDKPHRVTWALDDERCEVLSREPLPPALAEARLKENCTDRDFCRWAGGCDNCRPDKWRAVDPRVGAGGGASRGASYELARKRVNELAACHRDTADRLEQAYRDGFRLYGVGDDGVIHLAKGRVKA